MIMEGMEMEKTTQMIAELKKRIAESPEMMETVKSALFGMYLDGKVKTAEDMDKAVTDALLAMVYNSCPEAEKLINDEVWNALQA